MTRWCVSAPPGVSVHEAPQGNKRMKKQTMASAHPHLSRNPCLLRSERARGPRHGRPSCSASMMQTSQPYPWTSPIVALPPANTPTTFPSLPFFLAPLGGDLLGGNRWQLPIPQHRAPCRHHHRHATLAEHHVLRHRDALALYVECVSIISRAGLIGCNIVSIVSKLVNFASLRCIVLFYPLYPEMGWI